MKQIAAIVIACLIATPALAEEVLYCTETAASGFTWDDKGNGIPTSFDEARFTVKVISATERVIKWTGISAFNYTCRASGLSDSYLSCIRSNGEADYPIIFRGNSFIRSVIYGPAAPKGDTIHVAYGTCTNF
jgi:hypothetical protein